MASKKVFVGVEAVLAELDRFSDTETCSDASFDSITHAAYNEGEDPAFDLDSEEEWQPASLPNTSKEAVLPPPTSKTPTPSACGSVRPRKARTPSKQTRGSSHSVRGTKRPASVMSEDGERWNDCSVEDEVPALPNFVPKRNPGAQLVMDRIYSPLQLFQLFFTSSVLDTIVKNTNAFARMRSEAGKRLWRKRRDFREDITSLQ